MTKDSKNGRSFDLDKGSKRSFDLEKKPAKRFVLTKDDEEGVDILATGVAKSAAIHSEAKNNDSESNSSANAEKKTNWKPAVLVAAVIVLIFGGYLLLNGNGNDEVREDTQPQPFTEVSTAKSSTDEVEGNVGEADILPEGNTQPTATEQVKPAVPEDVNEQQQTAAQEPSQTVSIPKQPETTSVMPKLASTLEQQTLQVIRGEFGNGEERRQKLGASYDEIQRKVNEMYRTGDL